MPAVSNSGQRLATVMLNVARSKLKYVHSVIFGHKRLLVTNCLISATMGALGDSIQQNYEILKNSVKRKDETEESERYSLQRTGHMTAAGLTTGVLTHYWYQFLEQYFGSKRSARKLIKLVLLDQIIFSPVNLFVYFGTLAICERSGWQHFRAEMWEKGMENIYLMEWAVWPPAQLINFALIPLRYRILFDNLISLGFDIYGPYVKYRTPLSVEQSGGPAQCSTTDETKKVL